MLGLALLTLLELTLLKSEKVSLGLSLCPEKFNQELFLVIGIEI
jgi:hypothetical protein